MVGRDGTRSDRPFRLSADHFNPASAAIAARLFRARSVADFN